MSSIIKTGIDLLSIFPRNTTPFSGTYGVISCLNAYGYLQNFTPLGAATAFTSASLTIELLEFTRKQITSLKWIHESFKELNQVDLEIFSTRKALSLLDESHPNHMIFTDQLNYFNKSRSNISKKLTPYYAVVTITTLVISYFTHSTSAAFVNSALTFAVTYLPNPVLAFTSSLSISPMNFVIGTIGVTGFLIALYRESLKPDPKPQMIMRCVG